MIKSYNISYLLHTSYHVSHQLCIISTYSCSTHMSNITPITHNFNASYPLYTSSQIAKFLGPTRGPPGSYRPQMDPMMTPWTLQSGMLCIIPQMHHINTYHTPGHLSVTKQQVVWSREVTKQREWLLTSMVASRWNLTHRQPRCLSNFRAIWF